MKTHPDSTKALAVLSACLFLQAGAHANTIAYWRFEGDGTNVPNTDGSTQVEDSDGRTSITTGVGIRAVDVSGNGNTAWAWDHPWAGHAYVTNTPFGTVPATGASNQFSVQNTGDYPAMFTWSSKSSPSGVNLDTWTSLTWTIEASINCTDLGGWRTFVGREGNGVAPDPAAAPIYFQKMGDGSNRVRIAYADVAGNFWEAIDPSGITTNVWYSYAATCDGTTLKLLRRDANDTAYRLVASTNVSTSANPRLVNPGLDANGDAWGWTLGRGRYGTSDNPSDNHGDRWFGYLDEVRISDVALPASSLLGADANADQDHDDLPDAWEASHGLNPASATGDDGRDGDFDHDGWTNIQEYNMGTDPADPLSPGAADGDYDHDGLDDRWEMRWFGSTTAQNGNGNPDGDDANNLAEYLANSNPTVAASRPFDVNGNGVPDSTFIRDFSASTTGLADVSGLKTGFDTRLPGTGTGLPANDTNLSLDTANGKLGIQSTNSDVNGQFNMAGAEMIGIRLSSLGFSGNQDFRVRAKFVNLPVTGGADQIGIFAGTSSTALVRGGLIGVDTGLGVNTNGPNDSDASFMAGQGALRSGISMTVELSRIGGVWLMTANGLTITPTAQPAFLNGAADLVVGVYVCDLFTSSKQVKLDDFSVVCYDATPAGDSDHDGMLDAWEIARFGSTAPTAEGDEDGDGVSNFAEFAFGGNPVDPTSHGPSTSALADTDGNSQRELTLTIAVRAGATFEQAVDGSQTAVVDGIRYVVRGSLDLSSFNQTVDHLATAPADDPAYELHMFRLHGSDGLPGKGFLQAKASSE